MSCAAPVTRLFLPALACAVVLGCQGEMIRLGDATGEAGAPANTAGGAGAATSLAGTGASNAGSGGGGGDSAGSGGAACERGLVGASEVLWIGDSWITMPANRQTERVRELALAAGTIDEGEAYANRAAPAASMADVARQYEAQQAGPVRVKVLLMDGGTWDPIAAQMAGGSVTDAIDGALASFRNFLTTVATDETVEHIVYFLVPPLPAIPGVDEMREPLRNACSDSVVPCHFLDLRELWAANPDFTGPSGIQASEAGAVAIGDLVWQTMQEHCIAQ